MNNGQYDHMKKFYIILFFTLVCSAVYSQGKVAVYPTHWWAGMKNPKLQLMLHGEGIGAFKNVKVSYPGVQVQKVHAVENSNYLFVDLLVSRNAKPGKVEINIGNDTWFTYELKPRRGGNGSAYAQGVTQKDFVYLLMPDRFSNGDPANDVVAGMRDTASSRTNPFDRHGGDLQGVGNRMAYLKSLGVTALWMTPVVENDMARTQEGGVSRSTYHGYAFTDHYNIDRRFGGNAAYKILVDGAHQQGIKIIQDAVYNHVGADHFFIRDMPMKDWVNQWSTYQNTSYKDNPLVDPYASEIDRKISVAGWFTPFLADLNQQNPFVANFLIQHAIWSTEEFGIDGWRVDTYFYSDPQFLNSVNAALYAEFPKLTVFGEAWVQTPVNSAFFAQNNFTNIPFKHNTQGVTDFPLFFSMLDALNQPFDWNGGVNKLYSTLAQDIVYKDPSRNCIFLDNHDLDRFLSVVGEDTAKFKMGINWLLTLRGIPQLYYGTEIGMKNFKNPSDAEVRRDFPGGWAGDSSNKFEAAGRTAAEQRVWNHIATLANFRKTSKALGEGKLMHYLPEAGLYAYFRYHPQQTVFVVSHTGTEAMKINTSRFQQRTAGFTRMRNVLTGDVLPLQDFTIQPKESLVFELLK